MKFSVIGDVNSIARTFVEETVGSTSSAAKCGSDGVGIVTSSGGGSNPDQRPSKKPKVLSDIEERRLARLARSKTKVASKVTPLGTAKRQTIIHWELRMYLAEDAHPEEEDLSLLAFWRPRSEHSTCTETGEVEAGLPDLALIVRIYYGIESTSCRSGRNFSALGFLIVSLRNSMFPAKAERIIFLRLKRLYIPEVNTLRDVIEGDKSVAARYREKAKAVEEATAGKDVVLALWAVSGYLLSVLELLHHRQLLECWGAVGCDNFFRVFDLSPLEWWLISHSCRSR